MKTLITSILQDCTFSPKFEEHVKNLNDMHRHLTVHYGYAENYGKNKTDNSTDILREGFECLKEYCRDNNTSLVELFEKFDADGSMSVSLQEFQDGLKVSFSVVDKMSINPTYNCLIKYKIVGFIFPL